MPHETNMLRHLIRSSGEPPPTSSEGNRARVQVRLRHGLRDPEIILNGLGLALGEKSSSKVVNNRLYSNLMKGPPHTHWSNYTDLCIRMMGYYLWFALDDSDVQKPYGRTFEALSTVREKVYLEFYRMATGPRPCSHQAETG